MKSDESIPVYMDNHATTAVDPRVVETMIDVLRHSYGNPHGLETLQGKQALQLVDRARKQVSKLVGTSHRNVVFTSGATESINTALRSHIQAKNACTNIALSPIEHSAVLQTCLDLQHRGLCSISWLSIDRRGRVDLEQIKQLCKSQVDLICLMAANNEIGTIYPINEVGNMAAEFGVSTLCDGSQLVGHQRFDFDASNLTYLAFSSHKMYGPKGVGALITKGSRLLPLITGGDHENGKRAGTLNVPGIVGLGKACAIADEEMESEELAIKKLRDKLEADLLENFPHAFVNGDIENRLAGNLNICVPGMNNEAVIARVQASLSISTGAACNTGTPESSRVLREVLKDTRLAESCLRIGIGKFNTEVETKFAATVLSEAIEQVSKLMAKTSL